MPTVAELRAAAKAKREERMVEERQRAAVRQLKRVAALKPEHKPRGWKPVSCTAASVKVGGYARAGTKDGKLTTVNVVTHCRHAPK